MASNLVSDRPPSISLLRIFAVVLVGYLFVGNVLAALIISILFEGNLADAIVNPSAYPELRFTLLTAQGVASFVGLVLFPWYYLRVSEGKKLRSLFTEERQWAFIIIAIMFATISITISISPVVEWNAGVDLGSWFGQAGKVMMEMERTAEKMVSALILDLTPLSFAGAFLVVAVIPALGEELVFRGLIQTELQRATGNPHAAIWIGATLFSVFHFQFLGFVPRLLIGAYMGYLYFWSGNLWVPIMGHFFNNGLQLLGIYLVQRGIINYDIESTESAPWPAVVMSLIFTGVLMVIIQNYFRKNLLNLRDGARPI